ncbi:MAG: NYN domain-containing protein [Thermosynechococcaceae cyanobacterium]
MESPIVQTESTMLDVSVSDLIAFIGNQGSWHEVSSENECLRVFEGPLDDLERPICLVLPSNDGAGDAELRLNEAIGLLAFIGDRSPQQVVESIHSYKELNQSADVLPQLTTLLVDGYDIIHAWPRLQKIRDRHNLKAAKDWLSGVLSNYSAFRGYQTCLIFDAQLQQSQGSTNKVTDLLHIFYTESGQTIDNYIELYCAQARHRTGRIRVATSDSSQKLAVMGYGAEWMSAQQLVTDLKGMMRSMQESQRSTKQRSGR